MRFLVKEEECGNHLQGGLTGGGGPRDRLLQSPLGSQKGGGKSGCSDAPNPAPLLAAVRPCQQSRRRSQAVPSPAEPEPTYALVFAMARGSFRAGRGPSAESGFSLQVFTFTFRTPKSVSLQTRQQGEGVCFPWLSCSL